MLSDSGNCRLGGEEEFFEAGENRVKETFDEIWKEGVDIVDISQSYGFFVMRIFVLVARDDLESRVGSAFLF